MQNRAIAIILLMAAAGILTALQVPQYAKPVALLAGFIGFATLRWRIGVFNRFPDNAVFATLFFAGIVIASAFLAGKFNAEIATVIDPVMLPFFMLPVFFVLVLVIRKLAGAKTMLTQHDCYPILIPSITFLAADGLLARGFTGFSVLVIFLAAAMVTTAIYNVNDQLSGNASTA